MHKADEPDAVVDLLDTDGLTSQAGTEIDFLSVKAEAATVGNHDGVVVERVLGLADALIRPCRSCIDLSGALHVEPFMRPFVVEFF